jgi:hypothetical protein
LQHKALKMMKSQLDSTLNAKLFQSGASVFSKSDWLDWKTNLVPVAPGLFPPGLIVQIKALACELPSTLELPFSRLSTSDIALHAQRSGLVATISGSTIWRWLNKDAIRPWQHRCWIFPRDPQFEFKASRILDLYERVWNGIALKDDEFVISADEKTSIQARRRIHPTLPTMPHLPMKVEHEYERLGAWAYIAALDVHNAKVFGSCEVQSGIVPFGALLEKIMRQPRYRDARRIFLIVDNGSSHRGDASIRRIQGKYPHIIVVHGPVHASWLNQIEIYFSILQRKVLMPNDFTSHSQLQERIEKFERHFESIAKPFEWKFTRNDLCELMNKLSPQLKAAA